MFNPGNGWGNNNFNAMSRILKRDSDLFREIEKLSREMDNKGIIISHHPFGLAIEHKGRTFLLEDLDTGEPIHSFPPEFEYRLKLIE